MDKSSKSHRDRYDVSGNQEAEYADDAQLVLANKLSVTDLPTLQRHEERLLAEAYDRLLREVRVDTTITVALIRHVHHCIFGELYEWAGKWRTVWISKGGTTWPPPDFLDAAMREFEQDVLSKSRADQLKDDDKFCDAIGRIQGEFLVIHPFREGNARTIKLVTDLIAAQTGRPLLNYDSTIGGTEAYIDGAKAAFKRNYQPLAEVIRRALEDARRSRPDVP